MRITYFKCKITEIMNILANVMHTQPNEIFSGFHSTTLQLARSSEFLRTSSQFRPLYATIMSVGPSQNRFGFFPVILSHWLLPSTWLPSIRVQLHAFSLEFLSTLSHPNQVYSIIRHNIIMGWSWRVAKKVVHHN